MYTYMYVESVCCLYLVLPSIGNRVWQASVSTIMLALVVGCSSAGREQLQFVGRYLFLLLSSMDSYLHGVSSLVSIVSSLNSLHCRLMVFSGCLVVSRS